MTDIAILNIGTAIFALGLFAELMFDFDYGLTAPWWRSAIGWMFMLNGLAVLAAGVAVLLGRTLGPNYPGRPEVSLLAYAIFAASTIMRYGVFLHERRHPGSKLPMPYFDRDLQQAVRELSRKERRATRRTELRATKDRSRGRKP
jgi:hypothetical protein